MSKSSIAGQAVFLFTGQGSQYDGMGKDLYEKNDVFRKSMDRCDSIFKSLTKDESAPSLLNIIFKPTSKTMLMNNAQVALVSIEWSLAQMRQSEDMSPSIVVGHSVGEIAAACVAGAFSIETALEMAYERTKLIHQLDGGNCTMAAVRATLPDAKAAISSLSAREQGLVGVGSVNGPMSLVLSGSKDVVDKVIKKMGKVGMHLSVSHAFHSPLMSDMQPGLRKVVESLDMQQPLTTALSSTVTGEVFQVGDVIDAEHWVKQLTAPVLFVDAFQEAMKHDTTSSTVVEVGPKPILTNLAKALMRTSKRKLQWILPL